VAEGFVGQVRRDPDRRDRTSINAQTGFLTDDFVSAEMLVNRAMSAND